MIVPPPPSGTYRLQFHAGFTFDDARKAVEKALGKALQKCESGEDMRNCELEIAPQRTAMLLAEDKPNAHQTLIGCYYFYEK